MTETIAPPTCDAKLGMFDTRAGAPYCRRTLALRSLVDARGVTRHYCQSTGHRESVVRLFGEAQEPESADPITAAKGREWVQDHGGYVLVADEAPE